MNINKIEFWQIADNTNNSSIAGGIYLFYINSPDSWYRRCICGLKNGNDNICMVKMPFENKKIGVKLDEMLTKYGGIVKLRGKMLFDIKIFINNLCKKTCAK